MSHTGGFVSLVKKVASQDGDKLSFLNHPKLYIEVKGRIFYTLLSLYIVKRFCPNMKQILMRNSALRVPLAESRLTVYRRF